MKYLLASFLFSIQFFSVAQSALILKSDQINAQEEIKQEFIFIPSLQKMRTELASAPRYSDKDQQWIKIKIPFSDGIYHEVEVAEAPVVAKKIYDNYPENRSYKIRGINDKYISGRMSITPSGISALIFTKSKSIFIEPTQDEYHKAYDYDSSVLQSFTCGTDHTKYKPRSESTSRASYGANERKYIIAIASTGEFSAKHGNNLATINGVINDYLTLLNTLYERDLAVTFELTADNDDIIFFDPITDGFDPTNNTTKLNTTQTVINSTIGSGDYDIGHAFYEIDPPANGGWTGSGVAGLGVVCSSSSKARGWSGCGGPYPNSFWMEIFSHEVGHQFAATHTFYGTTANCSGSQRSVGNGVEPGSGNSLMSYEGTCGATNNPMCDSQNITPQSSFQYFHSHTIDQIQTFVSGSGSCYTSTSTGNSPPVITMPASKTIPTETPFYLSATVTDPDGDPLLNSWEEVDTDNLSLSCPNGAPNDAATSTTAPLFRSFDPSAGGDIRYFPQLSDILDDTQTMGEILPEVGRTIDMRFISRGTDANGISGVSYEDVTITVDGNSGPFEVTTATSPTAYLAGEMVNVIWTVGNTNQSPISCSNVNILFSSDGGNTFPINLASNVTNDGSHMVTMPGAATEEGRIKVEAVGNIFFSINKGDITIISDCEPNASKIINNASITANVGDPILDLGLIVGDEITSVSGSLTSSDPSSTLIAEAASGGSCTTVPTTPYYESYILVASENDTYTFTKSGNFVEILNLYEDEYIIPVVNCMNWLASNATYNPPNISSSSSVSVTLNAEDVIEMVVSGLFTGETGDYTVNFSSNGTGEIINTDILASGYVYKYVIYHSSGFIIAIEDEADLTDEATFYNDVYTVKGLMVLGAVDLSPYINQTFSSLQNDVTVGTVCGEFSTNDVTVTINGCNPGTKIVTSSLDDGTPGTLRYKMENVCPGDIVQFDPSLLNSTITLNAEIIVDNDFSVIGLGVNNISISGNDASRIFSINSGVSLSLSGLSLINGYSSNNGGAFLNNGDLQLENINFAGNKNGLNSKAFTNSGNISVSNTVNVVD
ncbi:MAG: hypothetical protein ACJATI_001676 [Halioglobus sp.]|jgi:hypothetical protein